MKLIVGLGNPGRKYEHTRHNVGFEAIHLLARRYTSNGGGWRGKFDGEILEIELAGERTLLLMPHTFMNLSGRSVRQAIDFFKLSLQDVLVICDDFHLELGVLRFRAGGTDGGQKGLADITQNLASKQFSRLRVGIGLVPECWNPADFVLGKFTSDQRITLEEMLLRAADGAVLWASDGIDKAMNQFNAKL
ncbi:MAG: aminoacyl-tRNA hydrolase [Pirellulales bacterium]